MREVDAWQFNFFAADVVPNIQLGPVADRKYTDVFAFLDFTVINVPKLRTLTFRVPLAKFIANRENTLFCACFFFVSACTANTGIELVFGNGI
ncbi:hypothetical protein D3C85_1652030 [compost metagenome]